MLLAAGSDVSARLESGENSLALACLGRIKNPLASEEETKWDATNRANIVRCGRKNREQWQENRE